MQIIKRQSDNVVIFAGDDLAIDQDGCSGPGWKFRNVDVTTLTIETVDDIPEGFVGGGWAYADGVWTSNSVGEQAVLPGERAEKIKELQAGYVATVYSNIVHAGHTWSADPDSRTLLAQVLAVGSVPEVMYWRDHSQNPIAMTYAELQALGRAILDRGLLADLNLMTKTAAVNGTTTAAEVNAIAW